MDYQHISCQICQRDFQEGDDIVVCPECGTPVHRACWQQLGHCVNEYRHGTGWSWEPPKTAEEEEQAEAQQDASAESETGGDQGDDVQQDPNMFIGPEQTGPYGGYPYASMDGTGGVRQGYHRIGGDETLGKYKVKEYASVIQNGSERFIPKSFRMERTHSVNSWNWAAFFFPAFWFAYRKMFGYALLALILTIIIPLSCMNSVYKYYEQTMTVMQQSASAQQQSGDDSTEEQQAVSDLPDQPTSLQVNQYVFFAVQILAGIFGNYLYKRKVEKILLRTANLNEEEREKTRHQKGGTSTLAVILVFLVMYALTEGALQLAANHNTDLATALGRLFHS